MASSCSCSGMRFCALCEGSDRVTKARLEAQLAGLDSVETVFAKNFELLESQSSCAFASLPESAALYTLCSLCGVVFQKQLPPNDRTLGAAFEASDGTEQFWGGVLDPEAGGCDAHRGWKAAPLEAFHPPLSGIFVFPNMIDASEEADIMVFLDHPVTTAADVAEGQDASSSSVVHTSTAFAGWKSSQSGRRKQDFGPQANFKKRKLKMRADVPGMPMPLKFLFERMSKSVDDATVLSDEPQAALPSFHIVESSALEYVASHRANLDPHIDDVWIWGPRVAGISLLSSCIMTFVSRSGAQVDVCLPRRWGFLLHGASRYQWLHGIRDIGIPTGCRRVSITMRELNPSAEVEGGIMEEVIRLSHTFV